jgi:hypothetical protein
MVIIKILIVQVALQVVLFHQDIIINLGVIDRLVNLEVKASKPHIILRKYNT